MNKEQKNKIIISDLVKRAAKSEISWLDCAIKKAGYISPLDYQKHLNKISKMLLNELLRVPGRCAVDVNRDGPDKIRESIHLRIGEAIKRVFNG